MVSMTLTQLVVIFAAGLTAAAWIIYKLAEVTIAEQKRKEAARKAYL